MAIDAGTQAMMINWAVWRLCRERPGMAVTMAYSLVGGGGSGGGAIPLINDEAFEVDQAVLGMSEYLRQAVTEYWLRSEPVQKKAQRCGCPVRTYWRRLERAHQAVHTYRRELRTREDAARQAYRKGSFSLVL